MHNLQQCPEEKLQLFEINPLLLANLGRLFFSFGLGFWFCVCAFLSNSITDLPVYCLYHEISSWEYQLNTQGLIGNLSWKNCKSPFSHLSRHCLLLSSRQNIMCFYIWLMLTKAVIKTSLNSSVIQHNLKLWIIL